MAKMDPELQKVANATCLIETETSGGKKYKGTGFYYGGDWVMTVAHNFQDDKTEANKTTHSIMSKARFSVKFYIEGQEYVFEKQKRMAFIHHLEPGKYADRKHEDIAMVKLGHQWEYGGREFTDWEEEEQKKIAKMKGEEEEQKKIAKMKVASLCQMGPLESEIGEAVYAVHFGGADQSRKSQTSKILEITPSSSNQVPMLHLDKPIGILPGGASGCPIMVKRGDKYRLIGLHFSGDKDNVKGKALALPWNEGIRDFIKSNKGVKIIADIGSYMAYSALASESPAGLQDNANQMRASLEELKKDAEKAKLTIYLCNGEVINQT